MQGDLISRSALIEYLMKSQSTSAEREHLIKVVFVDMVKQQPVAYDVQKVVKQLEKASRVMQPVIPTKEAIDIVRGGGKEKA